MRKYRWQILFGASLLALCALLFLLHFAVFHDAHHIWIYLLHDLAFLPAEVLIVTLILHNLLERHEKRARLGKLNMVIGAFFSEVGNRLLDELVAFDADAETVRDELLVRDDWSGRDYADARRRVLGLRFRIDPRRGDLAGLRDMLVDRRPFLLGLLENPNVLEHEAFTDLLWAVFHLTEELAHRDDLAAIGDADAEHLAGDIERGYTRLVVQWLAYMHHLQSAYPYLFSLAVRTNPLDPEARAEVDG